MPGLPDDVQAQILERAEGIPLYAVETVRMPLGVALAAGDRRADAVSTLDRARELARRG